MKYIPAKTIVSGYSENNSWFGCNYNMNIYKGCSHGCIYCDSRSECYGVEDFDTIRAKENAINIIKHELKGKRRTGVIGTGSMSDPYNPIEKELKLTREALKLIDEYGFGVSIATKSQLITRDIEVLKSIMQHSPVICKITITAFDDSLCRRIEPNVSLSSKRFEAIESLAQNGIYTGVLLMPVLPFITDSTENIVKIVQRAKECGANFIYPAFGLTLRTNQRDYYYNKLEQLFPGVKQKYIALYGNSYSCGSPNADILKKAFVNECKKLGIVYKMPDIITGYRIKYDSMQISMF